MQIQPPHRFALLAIAAFFSIFGGSVAGAQSYPTRPIQVIVPFAGGSASDVVTRILLDRASKALGQPFVVDNRPGAGGNTGTLAAARATPDGYTLVATGSAPCSVNFSCNAGSLSAAVNSSFNLVTIGFGVPFGASSTNQPELV